MRIQRSCVVTPGLGAEAATRLPCNLWYGNCQVGLPGSLQMLRMLTSQEHVCRAAKCTLEMHQQTAARARKGASELCTC